MLREMIIPTLIPIKNTNLLNMRKFHYNDKTVTYIVIINAYRVYDKIYRKSRKYFSYFRVYYNTKHVDMISSQ